MKQLHPDENILALHSGGDLDWSSRLRVALHVRACGQCRQLVSNQKAIRADLASLRAKPVEPLDDWDRLSDEMTANIRLGISAAECVGPVRKEVSRFSGFYWNPVLMASGAFLLLTGAFLLNMPLDRIERLWHNGWAAHGRDQSGLVLESTSLGLEMRRDGLPVISVHQPDRTLSHAVTANLDGSMSAGYVDDDTGQVTIINVASGQ